MGLSMDLNKYDCKKKLDKVLSLRKANAIHGWLSRNYKVINAKSTKLTLPDLLKLRDVCKQAFTYSKYINNLTDEQIKELNSILPVTNGFFFGSQLYDEKYFYDIKLTIDYIDELESTHNTDNTYDYVADW